MDPGFLFVQFLNGLATASFLFMASAGLTIVFGVTRIVNFAHGSFYMLGAYIAYTLAGLFMDVAYGATSFWAAILLSAVIVGLLGILLEVVVLRRIYDAPELFQLLATFAVVLIVQDLVRMTWGGEDLLGPRAPGLKSFVVIMGRRFPEYELAMILAGPLVLGALWLLFHRTRFGVLVRAATLDREMVGALGVNQALLFTSVLFLGAFLAGLAGALQLPREPANPFMDVNIIVEAFVVTVIGGMGSVAGAFLAALLIGELQAFGILVFPKITLVLAFLVMAAVLIVRPYGLLGRPQAESHGAVRAGGGLGAASPLERGFWTTLLVLLLLLPLFADEYSLKLMIELLIFGLFAFSLNFIMGWGGMVSFGHAAYFGLGAYGAALLVHHFAWPMEAAILVAPLVAGAGALVFGALCVRLSGVYLAMLTLAFAQIVYAIAFQWVELTGGDNGLIGIWPSRWAAPRAVYYYVTLAFTLSAIGLLWRFLYAPFGYSSRAVRDSEIRADAIGIDPRYQRWLAFTISGVAAGLGGGLYVFSKGNIDPEVLAIPTSVDALTMVLLGGVETVTGPLAGAALLTLLKDYVMPLTLYWKMVMGALILGMVLAFPKGLVGIFAEWLPALQDTTAERERPA